jgi:hypothetical protein
MLVLFAFAVQATLDFQILNCNSLQNFKYKQSIDDPLLLTHCGPVNI